MLLLPWQPWWWHTGLCLPGWGHFLHLFSSSWKILKWDAKFTHITNILDVFSLWGLLISIQSLWLIRPLSQLHMRLFARVLLSSACQLLGDDQLADVNAVAQQVGDHFFGMIHSTLRIPKDTSHQLWLPSFTFNLATIAKSVCVPVYEDSLQTGVNEVSHQRAVVSSDSLNAFTVHFVMRVCTGGEIQACVALLVDQQVWVVHLWNWNWQTKALISWDEPLTAVIVNAASAVRDCCKRYFLVRQGCKSLSLSV